MTLEAQIRVDLRRMDRDTKAFSRLIGIKREVMELQGARFVADQPAYREIAELVKDIPVGVSCECCGFKNLKNVCRKDNHIVGSECAQPDHPFGECKK